MPAAPTILWRHILREVALYTLLGLGVFSLLLIAGTLLRDIELLQILGGELGMLGRFMLVILPAYMSYIVPAALLCGVLLTLTRMSTDGEIVALRASGINMAALLPPVAVLGVICVAISAYISFDLEPRSHLQLKTLRRVLVSTRSLIQPGRVKQMGKGRTLFVAESGDQTCPLRGVVISDFREKERPYYVTATCGTVVEMESEGLVALDLTNGAVHFSQASANRYDRIAFGASVIELNLDELDFLRKRLHQYSFSELLGSMVGSHYNKVEVRVEIQRRLSFPLSGLVLALLALPLGIRPVRKGRSAGTLLALSVMGMYWCVFTAFELAAVAGSIPPWSLWLPNVAVAGLAAWMTVKSARAEV